MFALDIKIVLKFLGGIVGLFFGLILLCYGILLFKRPSRSQQTEQLFQGISYWRKLYSQPQRYFLKYSFLVHTVTIDLTVAGIKVVTTIGFSGEDGKEFNAQTTGDFLKDNRLQLAINGSYFRPFYTRHPLDFYPKRGDRVDALGQSIANGITYSPPQQGWNVLCFSSENLASIESDRCPANTQYGLAGGYILIIDGKPAREYQDRELSDRYPRTAVGIDRQGKKLWIVVIDGRQPFYSSGATFLELTQILLDLGSDRALILDGGGSTTLAIENKGKMKLLNTPVHTRIPMRQRPIANHLGFFALPLDL